MFNGELQLLDALLSVRGKPAGLYMVTSPICVCVPPFLTPVIVSSHFSGTVEPGGCIGGDGPAGGYGRSGGLGGGPPLPPPQAQHMALDVKSASSYEPHQEG